ncbi:MAG: 7TM-DISM domain-containing protein [Kiritimatiellae bacterium]|nr:7TM-DISM domain-containing protein [Kiritimatiellia bacterium]
MVHISGRSADIDEIRALPSDQWHALAPDEENLGFVKGEVWVRMQIHNADVHHTVQRVIDVPFARMEYLDWYVFSQGVLEKTAHSGSMLRHSEVALDTRYPALSFSMNPGESVEIYVRIASETVIHVNFRVWAADVYAVAAQRQEAYASLHLGILLALLALAYLFVWGFREVGSVWFPLSFTCFGVGVANLAGYWPDVPWMSCSFRVKTLLLICSFWSVTFLLMYARHFYELKKMHQRLARWTFGIAVVFFVAGCSAFWMPFRQGMRVAHIAVFTTFGAIVLIAITLRPRRVSSWLNLAAHFSFFGYIFTHLAFDLGLIPVEIRADSCGLIALSITTLLFILAQAWRVRELDAGYAAAIQESQAERELRLADQRIMLRDLHDGLGGMAATVSLMAAYGKRSADPAIKNDRFEAIERMTGYAGAEIRSLMNTLEHPAPYWADWLNDLRDYAGGVLEASRVNLDWECLGHHPEKWSGFAQALSLMRVIKEAVHNTVKHAGAKRVLIRLTFRKDSLEVLVQDNGQGFDQPKSAGGRGLSNMEKRVKELGGRLTINSTSTGTDILISVAAPGNQAAEWERPPEAL